MTVVLMQLWFVSSFCSSFNLFDWLLLRKVVNGRPHSFTGGSSIPTGIKFPPPTVRLHYLARCFSISTAICAWAVVTSHDMHCQIRQMNSHKSCYSFSLLDTKWKLTSSSFTWLKYIIYIQFNISWIGLHGSLLRVTCRLCVYCKPSNTIILQSYTLLWLIIYKVIGAQENSCRFLLVFFFNVSTHITKIQNIAMSAYPTWCSPNPQAHIYML